MLNSYFDKVAFILEDLVVAVNDYVNSLSNNYNHKSDYVTIRIPKKRIEDARLRNKAPRYELDTRYEIDDVVYAAVDEEVNVYNRGKHSTCSCKTKADCPNKPPNQKEEKMKPTPKPTTHPSTLDEDSTEESDAYVTDSEVNVSEHKPDSYIDMVKDFLTAVYYVIAYKLKLH